MVQLLTDSTICISFKGSFIHNASDTIPYYEAPFVNLVTGGGHDLSARVI